MNFPPSAAIVADGRVAAATARQRVEAVGLDGLLNELVATAQGLARVPVSDFRVGAVARGQSGSYYLGANIEFAGLPLANTVHAEQCAVVNAREAGETGIDLLVVSHMPCGHCRQFLAEIGSGDLAIRVRSRDFTLAQLLPESFGPRDLGVTSGVFGALSAASPGVSIERMTRAAAERSYAPHSAAQAGSPWSA